MATDDIVAYLFIYFSSIMMILTNFFNRIIVELDEKFNSNMELHIRLKCIWIIIITSSQFELAFFKCDQNHII